MLAAKHVEQHGLPDDWEYIQGEGHARRHPRGVPRGRLLPVEHENDHRRRHDRASRSTPVGSSQPIPIEDRFSVWKSEREIDIMVYLASLAGERLFFDGDNTTGVGRRHGPATTIAMEMEGFHAMGQTLGSHRVTKMGIQGERDETGRPTDVARLRVRPPGRVPASKSSSPVAELLERDRNWDARARARARSAQDGGRRGHHRDHRRAPGPRDRRHACTTHRRSRPSSRSTTPPRSRRTRSGRSASTSSRRTPCPCAGGRAGSGHTARAHAGRAGRRNGARATARTAASRSRSRVERRPPSSGHRGNAIVGPARARPTASSRDEHDERPEPRPR